MNSIEFLAIRKLQQVHDQTDYDISLFLEAVDGGDGTMEAALEGAMVEVADESYRPQGYPTPPVEEVASRPNGEPSPTALDVMLDEARRFGDPPFDKPIGISRDERDRDEPGQPEDSRGPSVVDRGSDEIELRWAKETIGLVAVVLNEAYAEFDITNFTTGQIPSGKLYQASRQLEEAMQRLGLTDHLTD